MQRRLEKSFKWHEEHQNQINIENVINRDVKIQFCFGGDIRVYRLNICNVSYKTPTIQSILGTADRPGGQLPGNETS